jgi:phage tail sheath protein FI
VATRSDKDGNPEGSKGRPRERKRDSSPSGSEGEERRGQAPGEPSAPEDEGREDRIDEGRQEGKDTDTEPVGPVDEKSSGATGAEAKEAGGELAVPAGLDVAASGSQLDAAASGEKPVVRAVRASAVANGNQGGNGMAGTYLSPGVYVEEIPSATQPIAGVGTSTAGFVGFFEFPVKVYEFNEDVNRFELREFAPEELTAAKKKVKDAENKLKSAEEALRSAQSSLNKKPENADGKRSAADAQAAKTEAERVKAEAEDALAAARTELAAFPKRLIDEAKKELADAEDKLKAAPVDEAAKTQVDSARAKLDQKSRLRMQDPAGPGQPILCTNFSDFRRSFGDFSATREQRLLAHAVYGFFRNGGSRCFVMRHDSVAAAGIDPLLPFEAVDEIAIVVAPGVIDQTVRQAVVDHCKKMKDRFAILDTSEVPAGNPTQDVIRGELGNTTLAALYFPWINVADPFKKAQPEPGDGLLAVPPSGHVAGIYARVDTTRGVHKAPANEVIMGAQSVVYPVTRSIQDGLNPKGINCLRTFNNNVVVWGARTLGGNDNGEYKYINVRRTMLFLGESIDEGTQWTVFEPNDATLWGKIRRNVTAFLLTVWRNGALFGATPAEAFFVKCDAETNPPEARELGQVVCEIGVAIVRPAEFVIFRVTQWAGPEKSS